MARNTVASLDARFWEKITQSLDPTECWEWSGAVDKFGYGRISKGGRNEPILKAHRVSWEIHFGPIPFKMNVLHTCDNPPCANPNHLFLGTKKQNTEDMVVKGRARGGAINPPKGMEKVKQAKLTDDDVREIRRIYDKKTCNQYALSQRFGVSQSLINGILKGQRWAHLL